METIEIEKGLLLSAYQKADNTGRELLESIHGKTTFIQSDLITWEGICKVKGIDPVKSLPYPDADDDLKKNMNSYFQAVIICEVVRGKWQPDWNNREQTKWVPYVDMRGSGSGFAGTNYDFWYTDTFVGSRLCFEKKEQVEFVWKHFKDIYLVLFKK